MNPTVECGDAASAVKVFCPRCGQAMLIATAVMPGAVACPHCQKKLSAARLVADAQFARAVPAAPQAGAFTNGFQGPGVYSWRNRWVAGALGVLLGGFGVHRFYLGFVGIGVLQILATVLTVGIVGPIWGFIEGILCFCGAIRDIDGRPLSG